LDQGNYVKFIKKVDQVSDIYADYTEEEKKKRKLHWISKM